MNEKDFFIGWAEEMPPRDRRFFLRAGLALTAGAGALGAAIAAAQRPPGPGNWDQTIREWRGIASAEPYSMLRTRDLDGSPRTAMLSCMGKCGVAARIGSYAGQPVIVRGSLISRGRHAMIAVAEESEWISADEGAQPDAELEVPEAEPLGDVALAGEILDSKCWFGAMRPSEGKVHKACASLCIRGGIPPALFARDASGAAAFLILTLNGAAHGEDLLEYVADPVRIGGRAYARGDLTFLDAHIRDISRL
jgi:hypothetical protein